MVAYPASDVKGETRFQRCRRVFGQLELDRQSWHPIWRDVLDYIMPRRGRLLGDAVSQANRGEQKQDKILDNTAGKAVGTMSSGFMTGTTNPTQTWFELGPPDKALAVYKPVRLWCEDRAEQMADLFRASNLYSVLPEGYKDIGGLGTAAIGVFEDDEEVFRFRQYPIGSFWLACDKRGKVDTFGTKYAQTVRQLVDEFGYENCSDVTRSAYDVGSRENRVNVCHLITPNMERRHGSLWAKDKPFSSCHYEEGCREDRMLRESGFEEFPILCPRWSTVGENVYGEAPAFDGIADVKSLQVLERRKSQAIDKQVNPPLMTPASLNGGVVDTRPGAVNPYTSTTPGGADPIRPLYQVTFQLEHVLFDIQQKRNAINSCFYADLFLMLANDARQQPPTAEEIKARQEEKLLALGPVLQRLDDELLDPLINRCFAIMVRRGLVPPAPEELRGKPLIVKYVSIMAQAQRLAGIGRQERLIGHTMTVAQVHPEVLDKIDWDADIDEYAQRLGAPSKLVRSDEEVAAIRQQRQQAAAQQQAVAGIQSLSKSASDLSRSNLDGNSALSQLVGGGGGWAR